ncbi:hypothetical protein SAMN05216207_11234 [Pseudonocardia ammonioxydans]|uniref:Transposase n=1 Tax=Pseudonocardia ammonioxydans TaxID=260086 RepID=A0A1I5IRP5_PSUAM|nr:hypothetical protein SAMN05216207_11234 [Pseudonocardia ammonioxydans]
MSVARFIADQRTFHRVPHTLACALLGVSISWLYKWLDRANGPNGGATATEQRRARACHDSRVSHGSLVLVIYHRGSRPGKRTTSVFNAVFQP